MNFLKKILIPFICILFLITSCKNEMEEQVEGYWVLENMIYSNDTLSKFDFLSNIIIFEEDKTCSLPIQDNSITKIGVWKVQKDNDKISSLTINSKNEFFNGTYTIHIQDGNKITIKLVSNKSTIECAKMYR